MNFDQLEIAVMRNLIKAQRKLCQQKDGWIRFSKLLSNIHFDLLYPLDCFGIGFGQNAINLFDLKSVNDFFAKWGKEKIFTFITIPTDKSNSYHCLLGKFENKMGIIFDPNIDISTEMKQHIENELMVKHIDIIQWKFAPRDINHQTNKSGDGKCVHLCLFVYVYWCLRGNNALELIINEAIKNMPTVKADNVIDWSWRPAKSYDIKMLIPKWIEGINKNYSIESASWSLLKPMSYFDDDDNKMDISPSPLPIPLPTSSFSQIAPSSNNNNIDNLMVQTIDIDLTENDDSETNDDEMIDLTSDSDQ